ncbi:MAG: SRPBCC domain-containing protein [Pseudomonadota bacterium]
MTNATALAHATNTLNRSFAAPPSAVFAAWADAEARATWGSPAPNVTLRQEEAAFEVGKGDRTWCVVDGKDCYLVLTQFLDIVTDTRIVLVETVSDGDATIGISLASAEFIPQGTGTHLRVTLQAVGIGGSDFERDVAAGWGSALDGLGRLLLKAAA